MKTHHNSMFSNIGGFKHNTMQNIFYNKGAGAL